MIVEVDDPDDPRVAAYRDIRERDLVGRQGLFVAEGEVVLRVLIERAKIEVQSVLLARKRVDKLSGLLDQLPAETPILVGGQTVIDAVAGFPLHRGVLAIGRKPAAVEPSALLQSLPPRAVVLALFGLGNHDNVGGLFRNAAAFGADAVLLDPDCCDPLYRKAIRVSVGAALTVPFVRLADSGTAVALLRRHGFTPLAFSPTGRLRLDQIDAPPRAAILLGAEGPGLPQSILAQAESVRIAMAPGFDSLNVAVAGALALHRLTADRLDSAGEPF